MPTNLRRRPFSPPNDQNSWTSKSEQHIGSKGLAFGGDDKWRNSGCPRDASRFHWGRLYETVSTLVLVQKILVEQGVKSSLLNPERKRLVFPEQFMMVSFQSLLDQGCFIEPAPMKSGGFSWTTRIPPLVVASKANPAGAMIAVDLRLAVVDFASL